MYSQSKIILRENECCSKSLFSSVSWSFWLSGAFLRDLSPLLSSEQLALQSVLFSVKLKFFSTFRAQSERYFWLFQRLFYHRHWSSYIFHYIGECNLWFCIRYLLPITCIHLFMEFAVGATFERPDGYGFGRPLYVYENKDCSYMSAVEQSSFLRVHLWEQTKIHQYSIPELIETCMGLFGSLFQLQRICWRVLLKPFYFVLDRFRLLQPWYFFTNYEIF